MLQRAPQLLLPDREGGRPLVGLAGEVDGGFAEELVALGDGDARGAERGPLALREHGETAVEHGQRELPRKPLHAAGGVVGLPLVGRHDRERDARGGGLRLGMETGAHALEAGHPAEVGLRGGGAAAGERGKGRAQQPLGEIGIDVTDDDGGHALRTVPFVPELDETLARGALNDLGDADRHATRQDRVAEHELELRDGGAETHVVPRALLAHDDAALAVDLGGSEQQAGGIVAEDAEALGESGLGGLGQLQQVEGAVETGGGVGVAAKAHAHALEELDERAGGEVAAAVEGHVLQEVGDAALAFLLVHAARQDEESEGRAPLGLRVALHDVAQAVVELAEARGRIGLQVAALVGETRSGRGKGKGAQKERREQTWTEGVHGRQERHPGPKS